MVVNPDSPYGTMLHIRHFEQLPDGRSRLDNIGTRRFRVLEWGEKDGYATARVSWLIDDVEPDDDGTRPDLRAQFDRFFGDLLPVRGQQMEAQLGEIPRDDVLLAFWVTALVSNADPRVMYHIAFGETMRTSANARIRFASMLMEKVLAGQDDNAA